MGDIGQKHFDAAGDMSEVFAARLGNGRAVHSETVIAASARMAGMMLFRSFGFDTSKMEPGSVVLSEDANEKGPMLVGTMAAMLEQYGLEPDEEKLGKSDEMGEDPRLDLMETQRLLEPELNTIRQKHGLDLEEGAQACALTTAWLIKECAPAIGVETGFNIAVYGFIEGTKTVPAAAAGVATQTSAKRPWWKFWG